MTLKEWSELTGILPTTPTTERQAVCVCSTPEDVAHQGTNNHAKLWHLTDYVVSSQAGAVVWLVPRKPERPRIYTGWGILIRVKRNPNQNFVSTDMATIRAQVATFKACGWTVTAERITLMSETVISLGDEAAEMLMDEINAATM